MAAPAQPVSHETHQPYVAASTTLPEFTVRAVILGVFFGLVFGASTVYLGLKVGLTVSASIPIAVLSITILRLLGRASILENNIVQTTGSAAESIAAGIVFTIPALLILGLDLDLVQTAIVGAAGGLLGVLLMIPLRRSLIVKEHGNLPYPEGTACAEVLVAGEKGGSDAQTVFMGFGVGFVYKFLMSGLMFWKELPSKILTWYQGARIAAEISPELLGVGYIIGPRIASYMLGGGIISALVLVPMVKFFGAGLTTNIFPAPAGELIANMNAGQVFDRYVRYIAAGAVAMGGIISLARSLPTIIDAFRSGLKDFTGGKTDTNTGLRTERDMPIAVTVGGIALLLIALILMPKIEVDFISAILILVFGFLFVTVSSRICGTIGSSSNPISGMTIATLLFTSLLFLLLGRIGPEQRVIALTVGAIVCVAAANAGNTSQDLKTGYLVGGTPKWQQVSLLIGALTSSLLIGYTLNYLNVNAINLLPVNYPSYTASASQIQEAWTSKPEVQDGKQYRVLRLTVEANAGDGKSVIPAGKYLVGTDNKLHYLVNPGVGGLKEDVRAVKDEAANKTFTVGGNVKATGQMRGMDDNIYDRIRVTEGSNEHTYLIDATGKPKFEVVEASKLDAPKAALMGVLVDGVLTQRLPWALILIGAMISIVLEIVGVAALPVAVGIYLPISTSATIFTGGLVRALVTKLRSKEGHGQESLIEEETGKGVLLSSGLIAGGAIAGLVVSFGRALAGGEEKLGIGHKSFITAGEWSNVFALVIFGALVGFLISVARKKSSSQK